MSVVVVAVGIPVVVVELLFVEFIIVVVLLLSSGLVELSSGDDDEFVVSFEIGVLITLRRYSLYFKTFEMLSRSENSARKSAEAERSNVAVIR